MHLLLAGTFALHRHQSALCFLQKVCFTDDASQSEERDVGGTVRSPHCHDKHVHPLQIQNNALLAGCTVHKCWWGSNKSDNNNVGVAQIGLARTGRGEGGRLVV